MTRRLRAWGVRVEYGPNGWTNLQAWEGRPVVFDVAEDDCEIVVLTAEHLDDALVISRLETLLQGLRDDRPRHLSSVPDPEDAA